MLKEFKEFAVKGNMIDMAVGIIIGGAFGKIVSSLVNDVIMPPIGVMMGGTDFSKLAAAVTLNYGSFIQTSLDFIIVAAAIFMMIKGINSLKRQEEEKEEAVVTPADEALLTEIRDLLKAQNEDITKKVANG
ncbi:UNVERIFIED_CONTAM: hypothetical protein GTU68_055229 [Idotea baltica]|nr:hypothetical protein [Idotea baltica]